MMGQSQRAWSSVLSAYLLHIHIQILEFEDMLWFHVMVYDLYL